MIIRAIIPPANADIDTTDGRVQAQPNGIITVNYNGVETSNPNELRNMKKQFENRTTYEIFYEYDANGLINKANVTR